VDIRKMSSDLLVTLPSNSNMSSYPNNEPSNYTVQLAHPIELKGDWEVALVSVQYTHNWITMKEPIFVRFILIEKDPSRANLKQDSDFCIDPPTPRILGAAECLARHENYFVQPNPGVLLGIKHKLTYILPQHFKDAQALGDEVCNSFRIAFPNTQAKLFYFYNHADCSGRFVINNGEILILSLDKRLGNLLGHLSTPISCGLCSEVTELQPRDSDVERALFEKKQITVAPNDEIDTRHWFSISRLSMVKPKMQTISSLWVYTDFIENQFVGNYKVPLLGVIPVSSTVAGSRTHYCVNPVYFVSVTKSHIDTIQIKLVTERGERIPYAKTAGDETNVVCCLRFRRRKSALPI
jgi:hypothetical protein